MPKSLRVLIVEDSDDDAQLILRELRQGGYEPIYLRVQTPQDLQQALANQTWDIVLSDHSMPRFDAFAALEILLAHKLDIPFILVSGSIGEQKAVEIMRAGAQDFIMKDNLARLVPAIERELREAENRRKQRETDEALRAAGIEWRATFDAISDAICLLDRAGRVLRANRSYRDLVKHSFKQIIGAKCWELIHETNEPPEICPFQQVVKTGHSANAEFSVNDKWFNVIVEPIIDSAGNFNHCIHIIQDITARKQIELALRDSEEKLATAIEMAYLGYWEYDVLNDTFTFNDQFYRIFHTTAEQVGGYTMRSAEYAKRFCHPDDAYMVAEEVRKAIETTDPNYSRQIEHRILYADGGIGYITVKFFIVKDSHGRTIKTYGVNQDITARKQAELALEQSYAQLRRILDETVKALASAVETRDPYTAGHERRDAIIASAIAQEMGLTESQIEGIRIGSLLHDIGKIAIPAEILTKPAKLTPLEYTLIKTHPQVGFDILKDIEFPWPIAQIVYQHQERLDGSGYPRGLKDGEIILEARILMVADVIEAMSSHRPYRPALGLNVALAEIEKNQGILYDPQVATVCLRLFREKGFKFE
ncbi:MAG: PAS domain-containing protein [bacterium]|nr:PAS domain-containing protein [bacterium]